MAALPMSSTSRRHLLSIGMDASQPQPATAVSLTAIAGGLLAVGIGLVNPFLGLTLAALALVCGIVAFTRLRSFLGVLVLLFGLLPIGVVLGLVMTLTSSANGG